MMRRLFWFSLGAVAALFGASWLRRKATELGGKLTPENVARSVVEHAVSVGRRIGDLAIEAWRSARDGGAEEGESGRPEGARG